jgi:hypothetical protein
MLWEYPRSNEYPRVMFSPRPLRRDEHGRVQIQPHLIHGGELPITIVCDRAKRTPHHTMVNLPPEPGWRQRRR